jgi:hypothetical protein
MSRAIGNDHVTGGQPLPSGNSISVSLFWQVATDAASLVSN